MSGGSEEGRGILETSPGAITVLILFFLLVCHHLASCLMQQCAVPSVLELCCSFVHIDL